MAIRNRIKELRYVKASELLPASLYGDRETILGQEDRHAYCV